MPKRKKVYFIRTTNPTMKNYINQTLISSGKADESVVSRYVQMQPRAKEMRLLRMYQFDWDEFAGLHKVALRENLRGDVYFLWGWAKDNTAKKYNFPRVKGMRKAQKKLKSIKSKRRPKL